MLAFCVSRSFIFLYAWTDDGAVLPAAGQGRGEGRGPLRHACGFESPMCQVGLCNQIPLCGYGVGHGATAFCVLIVALKIFHLVFSSFFYRFSAKSGRFWCWHKNRAFSMYVFPIVKIEARCFSPFYCRKCIAKSSATIQMQSAVLCLPVRSMCACVCVRAHRLVLCQTYVALSARKTPKPSYIA
jgi:hypothetical protein